MFTLLLVLKESCRNLSIQILTTNDLFLVEEIVAARDESGQRDESDSHLPCLHLSAQSWALKVEITKDENNSELFIHSS